MFSILTNFFKSTVRKKLYLHSNLWYIISFASQVGDHTFLTILNGHRWSSRSWKTFAMRLQGAPSIVKFAKVEGSSSLPLFKRFSWSLENRKWDRSLYFRRLNQNPERLLSLGYIVPGVPSIYQMDTVLLSLLSVSILSCVRTISRNTPSISSTTRGIWESSVSPRR